MPTPVLRLRGVLPVIVTLPATLADMFATFGGVVAASRTPQESVPVPHEVPFTVIDPVLVVTHESYTKIPYALVVPFAALPVIVTLPVPVAEKLADTLRKTPFEAVPVLPHDVPLTVIEPLLVVTVAP